MTITDLWGHRSDHHRPVGTQEWPPQLRDTAVTHRGAGPSCGAVGLGCAHPKLGIAHPNHGTAHPSPPHPSCWDVCPGLGVTTCRVSGCPGRALCSLSGCHHYFPGNIPTLSFSPRPSPRSCALRAPGRSLQIPDKSFGWQIRAAAPPPLPGPWPGCSPSKGPNLPEMSQFLRAPAPVLHGTGISHVGTAGEAELEKTMEAAPAQGRQSQLCVPDKHKHF